MITNKRPNFLLVSNFEGRNEVYVDGRITKPSPAINVLYRIGVWHVKYKENAN